MYDKPNLSADSVKVDTDEGRLTLEVAGDFGRATIDIHSIDLDAFYDSVRSGVGAYLRERDEARRTAPVNAEAWEAVAEDLQRAAYPTSSPKHPDFHSIHADIWDARDGK